MSVKLVKTTENISITLPSWLLEILDEVCEEQDFNRSTFAKKAIKKYLLYKHDKPSIWQKIYQETMNP